jgi:uncharacterized protein (TIGR03437 family)
VFKAAVLALALLTLPLFAQTAPGPFTSISAARFAAPISPGSIVSGFGANLSSASAAASSAQLPTVLGGVSVDITDSASARFPAPLYFVSPNQINYVLPEGVRSGQAMVMVRSGSLVVASGPVEVAPVAPALFTGNARGTGVAAGRAIAAGQGGSIAQELAHCNLAGCLTLPITASAGSTLYLELYGTGFRARASLGSVTASVDATPVQVLYAGPQSEFPGLDQINLQVPVSLANTGLRSLQILVDGRSANPVAIQFGTATVSPVVVQFDPALPETGPFPSDFLTIPDPAQKTGLRINMPLTDCTAQPSNCETYRQLNELDGFNLNPRLRVRFSGPVDLEMLRAGVGLVWLENLIGDEPGLQPRGHFTATNRGIFDAATNTYYAEPDEPLDQHRRYALVVTDAVRDRSGNPIAAGPAFTACVQQAATNYCRALAAAVSAAAASTGKRIVGASVFTTLSATSWVEKARSIVQSTPANLLRTASVDLGQVAAATLRLQTGATPPSFEDFTIPVPGLIASGTSRIFFGSFESPSFLDSQQAVAASATGAAPRALRSERLSFHVFLPSGSKPASGFPSVIFGHGLGDSAFGAPTLVAGTMARQGLAMVVINAVGHGGGPHTSLSFTGAATVSVPVPGRGVDLNKDGQIGSREGCLLVTGGIALRDCLRQTAVDLTQLTRVIRMGLDLDGDGLPDLDSRRIYYAGQSLGALYGTVFTAVEPDVRAAALNVGGGSVVETAVLSDNFHSTARDILAQHVPSLFNVPNDFDAAQVFRNQPVGLNTVPGAIEIQNYLDLLEWLQMPGDPVACAPHLKLSPLPNVPVKRTLFQIAKGDRTVPNPASSNLIRGAGALDSTVLYRHDTARSLFGSLPQNPHAFLVDIRSLPGLAIAAAAQQQIAGYLNADGNAIPDANSTSIEVLFLGRRIFERPTALPEDPGFVP